MVEDFTGFLELCRRRNHNAARLLEAERWTLLEIGRGLLRVECHLPQAVLNLGGFLFGGFTPTYVDFTAIWTCMTTMPPEQLAWLFTVNMRVDYLEPIEPPGFVIENRLVNQRRRDHLVETHFLGPTGKLLAFAITNLRKATELKLSG